ncbi:hypothetical protein [Altericista sp. CCNU0014]|uniref:hypothetical protein n=1 Tax=Altericista sp. CCNU0014 TaxID=3082949 RepID=UPI00384E0D93
MTKPIESKHSEQQFLRQPLSFGDRYPCPVCRYGQIEGIFWVDAFSCKFCRHIFTVDSLQQLRLEDTAQPLKWRWTGDRWVSTRSVATEESLLLIWGLGLAFVLIPTALVWLANHTFPALPARESGGLSFSALWTVLTFLSHGSIVAWFCLEYYQIPIYLILKLYVRRLFQPILSA